MNESINQSSTLKNDHGNGKHFRKILKKFRDINGTFMMNDAGNTAEEMSLSDTVYQGVFLALIPENMFQEFLNAN